MALSLVNPQGTALTPLEEAGGWELLLLDERRNSSVPLRNERPVDLVGGRGITTGPLRVVGSQSCATEEDVAYCT